MTRPTDTHSDGTRRRRKARNPINQIAARQPVEKRAGPTGGKRIVAANDGKTPRRKRILGALAAGATIIGVLSSGTALFDWFGHKVNPVTPPPAVINAQLTAPTLLDPHKPLGEFLADTNESTAGLDKYQLAEQGFEFLIRITAQGDQGRKLLLHWSIIDHATGNQLHDPLYNQDVAWYRPRGPNQSRQVPIWVPSPPQRGKYILRAVLQDEQRRPLVEADSKPFTVAKAPGP